MEQAQPIWMTKNENERGAAVDAVRAMADQKELARAATEAPLWEVRGSAVERLSDQALLAKIAGEDEDEDVRKAAEERLRELQDAE